MTDGRATPFLGLTLPLILSLCGAVACSSGASAPNPDAPAAGTSSS